MRALFDGEPRSLTDSATSPRVVWTFVWFSVVVAGTNAFGQWSEWSGFALIAPTITLVGVVGVVTTWLVPLGRWRRFEHASFAVVVATVLAVTGPNIATRHYFNTDAAAFNQRAAQLLVNAIDPYRATFRAGHLLLRGAGAFWTYTLNGGHVDQLSYPALSFLLQAPLQLVGLEHLTTDWVDLAAWIFAAVLLYLVSPTNARWLAPLLLVASFFTYSFAFGGTDALFVPFMMLAAWRWERFLDDGAARAARWLGPLSLGVACSIKQTPWFCVPFFLVLIASEAHARGLRVTGPLIRYAAAVAAPFVVLNAPFFLWSPTAWLHGILLPLNQPLIPDGQGLVSLATHGLLHSVHPFDLQLAAAAVFFALLLALALWYPQWKRTWLFAVPFILFVPSRSLSSYLVDFVPAAFVLALTSAPAPARWRRPVTRRVSFSAVGLALAMAIGLATAAFTAPALSVTLVARQRIGHNAYMGTVTLTFVNHTNSPLTPHVMAVVGSGHPVGFWRPLGASAPLVIAADASRTVTMQPPRFMRAPLYGEEWMMEVVTPAPAALVTSRVYSWPSGPRLSG